MARSSAETPIVLNLSSGLTPSLSCRLSYKLAPLRQTPDVEVFLRSNVAILSRCKRRHCSGKHEHVHRRCGRTLSDRTRYL